jgi:hypothetical protein
MALPVGFIAPCLPTNAPTPSGSEWVHEIKFDDHSRLARSRNLARPRRRATSASRTLSRLTGTAGTGAEQKLQQRV